MDNDTLERGIKLREMKEHIDNIIHGLIYKSGEYCTYNFKVITSHVQLGCDNIEALNKIVYEFMKDLRDRTDAEFNNL